MGKLLKEQFLCSPFNVVRSGGLVCNIREFLFWTTDGFATVMLTFWRHLACVGFENGRPTISTTRLGMNLRCAENDNVWLKTTHRCRTVRRPKRKLPIMGPRCINKDIADNKNKIPRNKNNFVKFLKLITICFGAASLRLSQDVEETPDKEGGLPRSRWANFI